MNVQRKARTSVRAHGSQGDSGRSASVVVIGAGHAGLAMSRCLSGQSIDHVLLERGEVANSWRHDRWDSLKLLTPNWLTRLPGCPYQGADPDGFMSASEVAGFVTGYAERIAAPVHTKTTVQAVEPQDDGYRILTDRGPWQAECVVLAGGAFQLPNLPAASAAVPADVRQITAKDYRNPDQLADGGVLVVGASATGLQLAEEIHRSGRPVTLSVGEHVRLPRTYRGLDIQYWLKSTGLLDEHWREVDDIVRARRVPSPQLVGSAGHRTLDLNALSDQGVGLVGRFAGIAGSKAQFSGGLKNHCAMADLKQQRLLGTIDEFAEAEGLSLAIGARAAFEPTRTPASPRLQIDLAAGEIRSIVWATGFRPDYSWLKVPVFDARGRLKHDGGVIAAPGLYTLGLNFMRRRKSSFIHGAADDARDLSGHLGAFLAGRRLPLAEAV